MDSKSLLDFCKEYKEFVDLEVEKLVKQIEGFKPFIISMDLLLKLLDDLESIESVYDRIDSINENKLKGKFTEFQKGLDAGRHQILSDIKILLNKYRNIKDIEKLKNGGCIFCDQELDEDEEYSKENLIKDWWGNTDSELDENIVESENEELENEEYNLMEENIDYEDVITEE